MSREIKTRIFITAVESVILYAGYVYRLQDQPAQRLLVCQLSYGHRNRGRPHKTFPDVLQEDTGLKPDNLRLLMNDIKIKSCS